MKKNNPIIVILVIVLFIFIARQRGFIGGVVEGSVFQTGQVVESGVTGFEAKLYKGYWIAQTFKVTNTFELTNIKLLMYRVGESDMTIRLKELSPDGAELFNYYLATGDIPTSSRFDANVDIETTRIILTSGNVYALTLETSKGTAGSNYTYIQGFLNNPYQDGIRWYSSTQGSVWSKFDTTDMFFEVWGIPTGCVEDWSCAAWSACTGGIQTRACTDNNNCGTIANKPSESQVCGIIDCSVVKQELGNKVLGWVQNQIDRVELGNKITEWVNC